MRRAVDDLALIVERANVNALRKQRADFFQPRQHAPDDFATVGALEHQDRGRQRLALAIAGHRTISELRANTDGSHVTDMYWRCRARSHNDPGNVCRVGHATEAAQRQPFAAVFDVARAEILVVVRQRRLDVVQGQVVPGEPCRVGADLELLRHPAPGVDVGDARHGPEQRLDDVLLHVGQGDQRGGVGRLGRRAVRLDQVFEDFAHRRCRWPEHRLCARRQLRHGVEHSLLNLRPREVEVDVVVEGDGDDRQARLGDRAHALRARQAEHRDFQRIAQLLLRLDGRQSRCGRHDDDLIGRQVGKGVGPERNKRPDSCRSKDQRRADDGDTMGNGTSDDSFDEGAHATCPSWGSRP